MSLGAVLGNRRTGAMFGGPKKPRHSKGMGTRKAPRKRPTRGIQSPFSTNYNPRLYKILQSQNYGPRGGRDNFEPNINRNLAMQGNYAKLPSTRGSKRSQSKSPRPITKKEIDQGVEAGKQAYQSGKKVYHSVKDRINRARGKDEGFRVSHSEGKGGMEFTETFRSRKHAEEYEPPKGFKKTGMEEL